MCSPYCYLAIEEKLLVSLKKKEKVLANHLFRKGKKRLSFAVLPLGDTVEE